MYQMKEDEVESLLQTLRQIRQKSGEMIAFLEHLMQLQKKDVSIKDSYNPDDYLEFIGKYHPQISPEREMAGLIYGMDEKEVQNDC